MYHRLKFAALGLVFGLAVLGTSYMTTSQSQAFGASAINVFQGGTGTTSPSGILYGDNGATPRLSTVTMGANCSFSAGVLNCAGGSGGTGAATSSFARIGEITLTTSASAITYGFSGLSTTTQPSSSNLLVSNGKNGVFGVATSTLTATSPLTGSFVQVGSGGTLGIQAASASQAGSMSAGDYQRLYTATTTFSSPLVYTSGTNAVTCPTCSTIANPFTFASTFGTTSAATTTSIWTQGVFFSSSTKVASQFPYASTTAISATTASTTNQYVSNISGALVLGGNDGLLGKYAGASACSANNFVTTISAVGGTTCGTAALNFTYSGNVSGTASANLGGTITITAPWMFGSRNNFSTSTVSTTTSLTTQGVFFASSTKAASQFPYASTTAITATTASSTNLIVSSAGGTGTRCVQVGADGTLSASASACAAGFSWPFTSINTFGTTSIATSTSITTQGAFYASSTVAQSNFAGNFTLGTGDLRSGAMFQMTSSSPSYLQYVLRNSQINPQATSSVDLVFENASSTNTTYFADIGFNSPTYTDSTFTICTSHCTYHYASDGALALGSATTSSTGIIQFFTRGTLAANEKARFTNGGNFGIATTTPWGLLSINPSGITGPAFTVGSSSATYFLINNGGRVGVASSTPWALLSIQPNGVAAPAFAIGSSTVNRDGLVFGVDLMGGVFTPAATTSTSTAIVANWETMRQQTEFMIGTSATTITFINATTSKYWGSVRRVWVCNGTATAGALTWRGAEFGATAPTQTTTANQCDMYCFNVTAGTSTPARNSTPTYKVAGSQCVTGFQ